MADAAACRVGRTGRAGDKDGTAWTLLDAKKDAHFAGLLLNSLTLSGQDVPPALHALAMKVGPLGALGREAEGTGRAEGLATRCLMLTLYLSSKWICMPGSMSASLRVQ